MKKYILVLALIFISTNVYAAKNYNSSKSNSTSISRADQVVETLIQLGKPPPLAV